MQKMTEAYGWSDVLVFLGSFGAPNMAAKRLQSNCNVLLEHLAARSRGPGVGPTKGRARCVNSYPDEFCDYVCAGLELTAGPYYPSDTWHDVGAADEWADAELVRVVSDLSPSS
jgi:hypothetical protein